MGAVRPGLRSCGASAAEWSRGSGLPEQDPERAVYNNALLDRDLGRTERTAAVDAMVAAYRSAGIDRYAAWVHESDEGMRAELSGRGYTIAESTLAMGMSLDAISLTLPEVELGPLDWPEYLQYLQIVGVPAGLLSGADPSAFHTLAARPPARTSPPQSPSTTTVTAASTTCPRSRRHDGEGSAPRSPHVTSVTPPNAAARPRACSPRRWPNTSTRQSASAISAGSSSTCRNNGGRRRTVAP